MSGILITIILIVIIIVLIIAYVLLSYFYNSYDDNKKLVNFNFKKTANYINDNITNSISAIDIKTKEIDSKFNLTTATVNSNVKDMSSNLNNYKSIIDPKIDLLDSNISNYDNAIKYYVNFKNNNNIINDKLYNYKFDVTPNLSMELLRNIDIISGMTIRTDNDKLFRFCDRTNASNCIDLTVNNGNFNIYPSSTGNNGINNLNIMTSNKNKVLANINFAQKSIYLGGAGEDAGLFINESNVYAKNLHLMKTGTNYSDPKNVYAFNSSATNHNTFKYDYDRLIRDNLTRIIGNYTINPTLSGSTITSIRIDVLLKSRVAIPAGTAISFEVFEFKTSDTVPPTVITLTNLNTNTNSILTSLSATSKILSGTIATAVAADTTIHFYATNTATIQYDPLFQMIPYSRAFIIVY